MLDQGGSPRTLFAAVWTIVVAAGMTAGAQPRAGATTRPTVRVSIASIGTEATGASRAPSISSDGRFIAFVSEAPDLVMPDDPGLVDRNASSDVFVHDRFTGLTERVSVSSLGAEGNDHSFEPSISGDGRLVVFASLAINLVAGDSVGSDVFVHDRLTHQTVKISSAVGGEVANGDSDQPSFSADGRYVAFRSSASNLVDGDTNGRSDVFVHDLQMGSTSLVSVGVAGAPANADSAWPDVAEDGSVVFSSSASGQLKVAHCSNPSCTPYRRVR